MELVIRCVFSNYWSSPRNGLAIILRVDNLLALFWISRGGAALVDLVIDSAFASTTLLAYLLNHENCQWNPVDELEQAVCRRS